MPEPIPILFTIPNFLTAGSGRALLNIARRLNRERFSPTICVSRRGGDLDAEIRELGIPLLESAFTVPARPLRDALGAARQTASDFRSHGFRLWHSFHYLDDYTEPLLARMAGARWVFTKKNMNWNKRSWILRSAQASRVVVLNSTMLDCFYRARIWRRRVRYIPRGIESEEFRPGLPPKLNLRSRLQIRPSTIVIACVANLVPIKGQSFLIEAVAKVPDCVLLLAGSDLDKAYSRSLAELAEGLGIASRVHFLGRVDPIVSLWAEADIAVLPTRPPGEGLPVALLESMACGVACIATRVSGSIDLIEDGVSGLLINPEDADELATALQRLVDSSDLRDEFGSRARQRVVDNFSIEREVEAHERLYLELVR